MDYKPNSVFTKIINIFVEAMIYLGSESPMSSSGLPVYKTAEQAARNCGIYCLALHRTGFTQPTLSPAPPVVSYTTLSPLPQ